MNYWKTGDWQMKVKLLVVALALIVASCVVGFGFDAMLEASIISAIGTLVAFFSLFLKRA